MIQDQTAKLGRVYVRAPRPDDLVAWESYGWRERPDPARATEEHTKLRAELEKAGVEILLAETEVTGDPDAIYVCDPVLMTNDGAVMLRLGKPERRGEPDAVRADLSATGVPIAASLSEPATAEGGDLFWLDASTLLVGRGYRTNDEGIHQLRKHLAPRGVQVVAFDLPHLRGPGECLHLLSLISPLAPDLAVAFPPFLPVRLVELLVSRGIELIGVPDEEFDSMGANVLALEPRVALALDGNPETRRRMEAAGVDVRTYRGEEISRKGDGGPTCLTRPLARG
jgi:dimethylargininase